MARIPESELERLKRDLDLVGLVRSGGVELEKRGRDYVGLCPFHDDTDPSLVITPAKRLWHCLGACQAGGSVIDWVMRREGLSFRRAVEWLLDREGGGPEAIDLDPEASNAELLDAVVAFYHATLLSAPDGTAYLESRGLNDRALIDRFGLGLANRSLGTCLPKKSLKAGERIRSRLQELGVLRESGHEHLAGSLVVPLRNEAGEVVQLYGRKLRDDLRKGTPLHLYLPGAHRGIWNREALKAHDELLLCESLIDAMTFWSAGYRNVTAAYGTNGFTKELEAALAASKRVLLAFDRDEAGEKAAGKIAKRLLAAGVECYRIQFPRGMDANEYAREVLPAAKSLGVVIRSAEWMGSGPPPSSEPAESGSLSVGDARALNDGPEPLPSLAAQPSSEPLASPVPPPAAEPLVALDVREGEVWAELGGRSYRVRGLERSTSASVLRVNLLVRAGTSVHVDTLDLYQARQRAAFVTAAAQELGLGKKALTRDLARLLLALERHQEERARAADQDDDAPKLTEAEKRDALELLQDPLLLDRILSDFARAGLVGEETNKLVGYLAAVSRKLDEPLAVIVQSSSAAGKTSLMDAVLAFVPPEERVQYSALTGQSLFYMQDKNLAHKILAVVEEEGAQSASYALKLLQSEGELTIASTGKDPETGKLVTHEYRVEGPVMIMLTTTAVELDEELLNRAIVLAVDEDRAQTRAIHRRQREKRTLEGLLARRAKDDLVRLHQNAQRLLQPLAVVNPYAPRLTFVDTRTRTRRDHEKYLTLIDVVALLHQHQREVHTVERAGRSIEYIEVTPADIELANRLAGEVLGRSLDELPPQTRRVLSLLDAWITTECAEINCESPDYRFTTREVREALGLGQTQARIHLARLVELEYLLLHRAVPGRPHVYELIYQGEGDTGQAFMPGLLDPSELETQHYDRNPSGSEAGSSGQNGRVSAPSRPRIGPESGGGRGAEIVQNPNEHSGSEPSPHDSLQIALLEEHAGSYVARGRNGTGQA
jgi:DNA primase